MSDERIYAVRRADRAQIADEWAFLLVGGPGDWPDDELIADAECSTEPVEYELLEFTVRVVGRRTIGMPEDPDVTDARSDELERLYPKELEP